MTETVRRKRAMASIFLCDDDCPFIVAETPREIAELVRVALREGEPLIELTLANDSDWNGKSLIARADRVVAACPPKDEGGDGDDT